MLTTIGASRIRRIRRLYYRLQFPFSPRLPCLYCDVRNDFLTFSANHLPAPCIQVLEQLGSQRVWHSVHEPLALSSAFTHTHACTNSRTHACPSEQQRSVLQSISRNARCGADAFVYYLFNVNCLCLNASLWWLWRIQTCMRTVLCMSRNSREDCV